MSECLGGEVCWLFFWVGGQRLPVKGRLASLTACPHPPSPAALDSQTLATSWTNMSQHTSPPRPTKTKHRCLPAGRRRLVALEIAEALVEAIHKLHLPRGTAHLRDHLIRAADNTALRLSEANGRTMGNRYQHLEAAYAENQEVQTALALIRSCEIEIPAAALRQADRLGGLIYGLLRADLRAR